MRVFLAFDLDTPLLERLGELSAVLAKQARFRARFYGPEGMHLTARFLGEVDDARLPELLPLPAKLASARLAPALRVAKLEGFPEARRARVFVATFADDATIATIAADAESAAVSLGFAPEPRRYRPHITLARLREPADVRKLTAELTALSGRAIALTLYRSVLGREGASYEALARQPMLVT